MTLQMRKLFFYIDGFRYSCAMANLALTRLRDTLDKIAIKQNNHENFRQEEVSAFLDAWVIVDMCHRARGVIQQIPGLPKNSAEIQIFLRATTEIEKLRHHVQHFQNGIHEIPEETFQLWGSLSWHPSQDFSKKARGCYVLVSGNFLPGVIAPSCSLDTREVKHIPQIMLFAGKASTDLLKAGDHLRKVRAFIYEWVKKHPNLNVVASNPFALRIDVLNPAPTTG